MALWAKENNDEKKFTRKISEQFRFIWKDTFANVDNLIDCCIAIRTIPTIPLYEKQTVSWKFTVQEKKLK